MGLRYDKTTAPAIARAAQILSHSKQRKASKRKNTALRQIDAILMMYQTESLEMVATKYEN